MTRYTMVSDSSNTLGFAAQHDADGEWVRYFELAAARAEIERLTKERDIAKNLLRSCIKGNNALRGTVQELKGQYTSYPRWLRSMLADAERDMRQRAADACSGVEVARWDKWKDGASMLDQGASDGAGECVNAILALPLKHADQGDQK